MGVYSYMNVQASLVGPGGNVNLGFGSGSAEEALKVEMVEEKGDTKTGSDGQIMQSLRAGNVGRITCTFLKTSPTNALLSQMYNTQKTLSSLWGNNVIRVSDTARGDVVLGTSMAFVKQPDVVYGKDGDMLAWIFVGNVDEQLGSGQPVAA